MIVIRHVFSPLCSSCDSVHAANSASLTNSHNHVEQHDPCTQIENRTAYRTHYIVRVHGRNRFNKGVGQRTVFIIITPHQTLHDTGDPHRNDVSNSADQRNPEVNVNQLVRVHFCIPQLLNQMIQSTEGDHGHPAQSASVNVTNCPVSVV